jgi:hypothetical protein
MAKGGGRKTPAGKRAGSRKAKPAGPPAVTEDAIRARAYELSQARGAEPGHELDDWLEAESQLRAEGSENAS